MVVIHNLENFILNTSGCYTLSEALDIDETAKNVYGVHFNWVNCKTGNPVTIGRTGGRPIKKANPQPIPQKYRPTWKK